jgi:hypothetical protein
LLNAKRVPAAVAALRSQIVEHALLLFGQFHHLTPAAARVAHLQLVQMAVNAPLKAFDSVP